MVQPLLQASSPGLSRAYGMVLVVVLALTAFLYVPWGGLEVLDVDYGDWIAAATPPTWGQVQRIFRYEPEVWGHLGYFAPLTAASFLVDVWLGGLTGALPEVHRAINLALHLLNGLLVFAILRGVGLPAAVSLLATAIFLVHPLQVSSLAWVPERKNLLAGAWFLAGILSYLRFRQSRRWAWYGGAVAACGLALLSKPSAVVFGPCLVLTDWFLLDQRCTRGALLRSLPFCFMGLVWALVAAHTEPMAEGVSLGTRLLGIPCRFGFMLGKFVYPVHVSFLYPPLKSCADPFVGWLSWAAVLGAVAGLVLLHRQYPLWTLWWAVGWYVIQMLPSSGLVPFGGMHELAVADHYLYLALLGPAVLVAHAAGAVRDKLPRPLGSTGLLLAGGGMVVALALLSLNYIRRWDSPDRLWKSVLAYHPHSLVAHMNYGTYLHERGRHEEALVQYHEVLRMDPTAYRVYYNIGLILRERGDERGAAQAFAKVLELCPGFQPAQDRLSEIFRSP